MISMEIERRLISPEDKTDLPGRMSLIFVWIDQSKSERDAFFIVLRSTLAWYLLSAWKKINLDEWIGKSVGVFGEEIFGLQNSNN